MPAIINNDLRIFNSDAFTRAVAAVPTYLFIGKESTWVNENNPPVPIDSNLQKTKLYKDIVAIKKVVPSNIASVIPRIDWTNGNIYDEYDHRVNLIDDQSPDTGNFYQLYVVTDEFNVYKCISNNGRVASIVKPTGSPITPFQTADGYVWKYMYTIPAIDVFSYLTNDWMPCYTIDVNDGTAQWQVQQTAIDGAIDHIVVENGGSGYDPVTPPDVVIVGDGSSATATANVDNVTGEIKSLTITNVGSGYTDVSISLQNTNGGAGFSSTAILSPIGGHGYDAKSELGAIHKMIRMELSGDENGTFPATSYRQAGILSMPLSTDTGSKLFFNNKNAVLFKTGQLVTGQSSGATGIVRYIDIDGKYLYVDNITGAFIQTETVQNSISISAPLNDISTDVLIPEISLVSAKSGITKRTGKFLYVSNRTVITRTVDQTEDIRVIISF